MLSIYHFFADQAATIDDDLKAWGPFILILPFLLGLVFFSLGILFFPVVIPFAIIHMVNEEEIGEVAAVVTLFIIIITGVIIFYFFGAHIISFYSKALHFLIIGD